VPLGYGLVLAAYRGDDRTFDAVLARVEATPDPLPGGGAADTIEWARAAHELAAGRHDAALAHLNRLRHPVTDLHAGLDAIEAAARAEDERAATAWLDELDDHAHATGAAWALARAAHGRALLSSGDEATALFEAALAHHSTTSRPFERARTLLALGEHLRRARRRVDARAHLRAALDAFEHLNAAPWAERARNELRASGETARRRVPSTMSQLTPQERQVARFVAQGLPNREVAAQLFVSPRTVDFHLRNVFTKLGVTSRTELARLSLD
jgi:DNA-binding NarL/FixJ family response regulator